MKFLIIFSLFFQLILANGDIIKFHAKIFPKILSYDLDLDKKIHDKKVTFAIVYNHTYSDTALNLKDYILDKYSKIKNFKLEVLIIDEIELESKLNNLNAIYLFNDLHENTIKKVLDYSVANNAIIFANKLSMLENRAMIGLEVKKSFIIYVNSDLINRAKIDFHLSFLKVIQKYE